MFRHGGHSGGRHRPGGQWHAERGRHHDRGRLGNRDTLGDDPGLFRRLDQYGSSSGGYRGRQPASDPRRDHHRHLRGCGRRLGQSRDSAGHGRDRLPGSCYLERPSDLGRHRGRHDHVRYGRAVHGPHPLRRGLRRTIHVCRGGFGVEDESHHPTDRAFERDNLLFRGGRLECLRQWLDRRQRRRLLFVHDHPHHILVPIGYGPRLDHRGTVGIRRAAGRGIFQSGPDFRPYRPECLRLQSRGQLYGQHARARAHLGRPELHQPRECGIQLLALAGR